MAVGARVQFAVAGKRALITGAGSGINYNLTKQLLGRGCSVLLVDLGLRDEAQKLLDEYASGTPKAVFYKADVTDWTQLQGAFEKCKQEFGGIDIVGPGAGVFEPPWSGFWYPPGSLQSKDTLESSSYKTLDINVTHPIRAAQIAISEFLHPKDEKDRASVGNPKRIIMTSSIAGQAFGLFVPLYFASKHAISAFTRSLGPLEDLHGIRVNAVAPAIVKTPLWTEHPEKLQMFDEETDIWVTPEEVAENMIRLMEDPALEGGTILEIVSKDTRIVPAFNNPGPSGPGVAVSNSQLLLDEAVAQMETPGWGRLSGQASNVQGNY